MQWDPHNPQQFAVSMEDGHVLSYDARKNQQPIFLLKAHNETCTSLAFCPVKQNIMVTGSTDKTVKMWSINNGKPELVKTNISYMNPVYSLSFLEDKLSVGGDKGGLKIWKMDFKSWKDPKTQ
jgi:periodic tryptophan protein 1